MGPYGTEDRMAQGLLKREQQRPSFVLTLVLQVELGQAIEMAHEGYSAGLGP